MIGMRKKIRTANYTKAHLLYRKANEYEYIFICFVKFRSRPPVSLNCFQGQEFRAAAFYSSKNYGLCIFLACAEIIFTSEKGSFF